MMRRLRQDRPIVAYVDLHGHSKKQNVFMYGCQDVRFINVIDHNATYSLISRPSRARSRAGSSSGCFPA